jgi:2-succinyl-6-hydroxy-2,4-cyclohexadiene-1-carboxylate synthase
MSLLSVQRQGSGSIFVWLHGFTQTRDSAHQFRSILAGGNELWTLDLPGHGSACAIDASLEETADLVADILPDGPVALGGYSFGARVALHVAVRHPTRLSRLVLLGASRGIEDAGERAARRAHDEQLADRIERIGVTSFLDEWLAQPMFANLPHDPLERAARSTASARGLAQSLRRAGTGTQAWLAPLLPTLSLPTIAMAGDRDPKFTVEAMEIAHAVGLGRFAAVPDAGHAAHLEQPHASATIITTFLAASA